MLQALRALDKREYLVIIRENFCLILHINICCDPSSEPSQRDASDEWSQHMVSIRNKKNYHQILPLEPWSLNEQSDLGMHCLFRPICHNNQ